MGGANIKNLRLRIKSVDNTRHLTRAMGLVAASKIRKATEAMIAGRDFAQAVSSIIDVLVTSPECAQSPFMQDRGAERTRIIVIAGDRGMAGGYNSNIFRLAAEYPDAEMIPLGKRACDRFHRDRNSSEHFFKADAANMAALLCKEFAAGEFDRLGIISTHYRTVLSQEPGIEWILPLQAKERVSRAVIFEPDELSIFHSAVPEYVAGKIMAAVRESFACEVTARRTAMDSADRNAQEMIEDLTLQYNRARQGSITQEITEIVSGSGQGGTI
ncbi:MAG: ATP synthase F1 subunit gamma [Firmicutes bacterium]|nr:ATP synthase F1 subunit gamma [Bacillota bacterium]